MLSSELARQAAGPVRNLLQAASATQETAGLLASVRKLAFFHGHDLSTAVRLNMNRDFFPRSQHWPVWPRSVWPSFGRFLEENAETFRRNLQALLALEQHGEIFRVAAEQQPDQLSKGPQDWARIDLVNSGGPTQWCRLLPQLRETCELLAPRPEINENCETYLAGAALARLLPGAELRPHFDSHGRLAAHLGLETPPGAMMTVGGEQVQWTQGKAVVFDDTYVHSVTHDGNAPRYILITWICHPCDVTWRAGLGQAWLDANPLPEWCGEGGGHAPVSGYGDTI
eukprot:TRINITY_DN90976_c0_g1_i1.p1 TRINITY_DN90976_c0_g1~~TRINITY_DN90976_c0_g1_i1.p1  ORF type:complete len:284 (+),score=50.38 TRINITY_DN90976_c0_g1_i1:597-1448(+)